MQGWFKLYRKIINSPVFNDPHILRLWMLCLSKATHKEREILVGKQQVKLNPGEFVTGRDVLALEYNMGLAPKHHVKSLTIWRWLKALEEWENVNIKSTTKYSVISIVNWSFYQEDEQQNDQQMISKCTSNDQQMITNKNDKNVKNEKKNKYAEFVSMKETEYRKLVDQFGEERTLQMIEKLDNYKGSKGKKYKDDYRAILGWPKDEVLKKNPLPKPQQEEVYVEPPNYLEEEWH